MVEWCFRCCLADSCPYIGRDDARARDGCDERLRGEHLNRRQEYELGWLDYLRECDDSF